MMTRMLQTVALAGAISMSGCGGDDGDSSGEDSGSAPSIEALSFGPPKVPAGKQSVLTGKFTFHDPDSDADRFAAAIVLPDGSRQSLPPNKTQGTDGRADGQVEFLMAVAPPVAGNYAIELWMVDAADHESNHLDGGLEAN
jgi:hypothetical protein